MLYRDSTPIEEHLVRGRRVFVKRDDLFGQPPAPPLGKLRGLRTLLDAWRTESVQLVGCWDTRVSRLGEGLAAACTEFDSMRAIVSFPTRPDGSLPLPIQRAAAMGAELLPLRGNHVRICYNQARKIIEKRGGRILPFGLECDIAVEQTAREAATIPSDLARGTMVLSCGSGVTLSGILRGLPATPQRVLGLSSGRSVSEIQRCVQRYCGSIPKSVEILPAAVPYYESATGSCPFPAHPNYDGKAWELLAKRVGRLLEPILFWNIGA